MFTAALIPDHTVVREKGDSPTIDVSPAAGKILLLTLEITDVIEQQSIDLAVWGSSDDSTWGEKPLLAFPQKF